MDYKHENLKSDALRVANKDTPATTIPFPVASIPEITRRDSDVNTPIGQNAPICSDKVKQIFTESKIGIESYDAGQKQIETALRQSETRLCRATELLEAVTEGTNVLISAVDSEFRYTYFNDRHHRELKRLTGKDTEIGMSLIDVLADMPDQLKIALELWSRALKGETVIRTLEFGDPGRYRRFYNTRHTPIRDADGVIVGAGEVTTDITMLMQTQEALRESEERFKVIAETTPVGIGVVSVPEGKFLYVNAAYEKKYGFSKDELLDKCTPGIYWDIKDRGRVLGILKEQGIVSDCEVKFKRKDGTPFWGLASVQPITFGGKPALLGIFVDITERKKTEEKLQRLNGTLAALGRSSQAMMHAKSEPDYLKGVCRIIVEECGYKMVWIGFVKNDEEKTIEPVVYAGFEQGYIENLNLTWADTERGQGPTGTAIRTGKVSMCSNMLVDPAFAPWRDAAIRCGYASSIVFPLMEETKVFGVINIYSEEVYPFSDEEVRLLSELADDLAHGIMAIRLRAAQAGSEEKLRRERNFINAVVQTTGGLIVGLNIEGRIQLFNRACEKATSYKLNEVKGRVFWDFLLLPEEKEPVKRVFKEIQEGSFSADMEFENYWVTRDGGRRFIRWANSALRDENGDIQLVIGTGIDITERKNAEEEILRTSDQLRQTNEDLERFNRAMVDRELRIIELKKQINELCVRLGESKPYSLNYEEPEPAGLQPEAS